MAEVPARSLPAHDAWYGIVTKNEKPAPPRNWTSAFGPMVLPWRVEVRQVETRRDAGALKRRQQMRKPSHGSRDGFRVPVSFAGT